jgi:Cu/Ag efflux pump CusA
MPASPGAKFQRLLRRQISGARGHSLEDSGVEGAVPRLRPILMTSLAATLRLLPTVEPGF